jgi:predicted GTPase
LLIPDFVNSFVAMGGSNYDDDWVLPSADITLVLVGKLGYGKSATGNSILGREAFVSEYSHASVTNTCQMGSTTLRDGRTINVIDTPGKSACIRCNYYVFIFIYLSDVLNL